jgi:hypothetical protein
MFLELGLELVAVWLWRSDLVEIGSDIRCMGAVDPSFDAGKLEKRTNVVYRMSYWDGRDDLAVESLV